MIDLPGSHLAVFFIHRDLDRLCTLEYNLFCCFFNNFSNKTWVKGGRMTIICYSPPRCLAPFPSCWNKSEKFPSFSFIEVLWMSVQKWIWLYFSLKDNFPPQSYLCLRLQNCLLCSLISQCGLFHLDTISLHLDAYRVCVFVRSSKYLWLCSCLVCLLICLCVSFTLRQLFFILVLLLFCVFIFMWVCLFSPESVWQLLYLCLWFFLCVN